MAECRSCGATITWLTTPEGRKMPANADPSPRGTIVVDDATNTMRFARATDEVPEGWTRYVPHWATCPDYRSWKKKGI